MSDLYNDHVKIVRLLKEGDEAPLIEELRHHLSRLDDVITGIQRSHADFFED